MGASVGKTRKVPNLFFDPGERSSLMSSIRSKNTKPELIAFAALQARGVSFRRHYDRAPGNPDIARPRKKLAVFIDGDFWHGRELGRVIARYGEESSWAVKLRRNVARDLEQAEALRALGWTTLRVWESDLKRKRTRSEVIDLIETFLRSKD